MINKRTAKNRQKSRVIPGTKIDLSKPPGISAKKRKIMGVTLVTVIILYVFNFFTGIVMYGAMFVVCLGPPITSNYFMGGSSMTYPGEPFYGPGPYTKYYCERDYPQKDNASLNILPLSERHES